MIFSGWSAAVSLPVLLAGLGEGVVFFLDSRIIGKPSEIEMLLEPTGLYGILVKHQLTAYDPPPLDASIANLLQPMLNCRLEPKRSQCYNDSTILQPAAPVEPIMGCTTPPLGRIGGTPHAVLEWPTDTATCLRAAQ